MREGLFIKKNKDRWEQLEHHTPVDPDLMASEFTKLVDDLAYAKTFYRTSRVTTYINAMAAKIYLGIYRNRKEEINRLVKFWKHDVPSTIARHYRIVFFSLAVFVIFFAVGFFSAVKEPEILDDIIGQQGYVEMTERNIEAGNPFGVYQHDNAFVMFINIMMNNVLLSFRFFFFGIFLGIKSFEGLVHNSIMIGAFEQLFHRHGLGLAWVLAVLIHGLLEITALILACSAGMILGTGFLFPGTGRRWDAFKQGAKDGAKLIIGLVPIFITAAIFESYVTRYYKMPLLANLLLVSALAFFVAWYFIIRPVRIYRSSRPVKEESADG